MWDPIDTTTILEWGQANHSPATFSWRRPSCGGLRESPTCILQLAGGFAPLPAPRPGRAPAATAGAGSRPRGDAAGAAERGPFPAPPGHKEWEAWAGGRTRPQAHSCCRGPALGSEEGAFLFLLFPRRRDKGGAGGLRSPARGSRQGRLRCSAALAAPGPAPPRTLGVEPTRLEAPGGAGSGAARLKVTLAASPAPRPPLSSSSSSPGTCRRCRRPALADPPPCLYPRRPTGRPARRWPCCRGSGRRTRRWGCRGRRTPPWLALPAPAPHQAHAAARGSRSVPPASASSFPSPPGGRAVPPLARPGAAAYRPDLPRQPDPCPQLELAARSRGKPKQPPPFPAALFPTAPPLRLPVPTTLPSAPRGLPHARRRGEPCAEHAGARSPRGPHLRPDGASAVAPGGPAAAGGWGTGRARPWRGRDGARAWRPWGEGARAAMPCPWLRLPLPLWFQLPR